MDKKEDKPIEEVADAYLVQKNQRQKAERILTKARDEIDKLESLNQSNDDALDVLLLQAGQLAETLGYNAKDVSEQDIEQGEQLVQLSEKDMDRITIPYFEKLSTVEVSDDWNSYTNRIKEYADEYHIDLNTDPFSDLLSETEKNEVGQRLRDDYIMRKAHCDKYDYAIAAFCGIACGLMDSFFVGAPSTNKSEESKLAQWTDQKADNFVSNISKKLWNKDNSKRNEILELFKNKKITKDQRDRMLKAAGIPYNQALKSEPKTLQQCIQYLEKKYKVNYDASSAAYIDKDGVLSNMRPINHHIVSLAHSPSIIGLLFSILDQFTGDASFVDNGKLIRVPTKEKSNDIDCFELRGTNVPTKLICGFTNWLGHLCSDLVGSNTTRVEGSDGRGSGLPVPFMELLQFCTFEVPDGQGETIPISELTIKLFEKGYDLRFAVTTAIPVVLNEFMIRLLWSIKSRFYHKRDWSDSLPFGNHPELRRMLLAGHGALCLVDGVDAGIRSVDLITFAMHLNAAAWARFGIAGLQEIRALYKENVIDVEALDNDLEIEWRRLYKEVSPC